MKGAVLMKPILLLVSFVMSIYLLVIGILNLVMFTNFFTGIIAIVTSIILFSLINNSTDEREVFGKGPSVSNKLIA